MVFSSFIFLGIFLPVVVALYFMVPSRTAKNVVLLGSSLFFYAWGEPVWIVALIGVSLIAYVSGLYMERLQDKRQRKRALAIAVIACAVDLVVFKYLGLLVETFNLLPFVSLPVPHIALPVGISFYTFQAMSYVIDVYRKTTVAQHSYPKLLLYISMFPQLVAGPIVRYSDISEMIDNRNETTRGAIEGFTRFAIGLGKKVLIANYAGSVADSLMTEGLSSLSATGAWVGLALYTLHIQFDFSGYSDMAIGLGKVFGFDFKENFNYPYISRSVTDFWRRWHISLGSFFRDYVYIPLGGNRRHQYLNIAIVWALTGIWHGASWNFMLWGLYYAVFLVIEKNLMKMDANIERVPVFGNILLLLIVMFGWSLFYYTDLGGLKQFLTSLFGLGDVAIGMTAVELSSVMGILWLVPFMVIGSTPLPARVASRLFDKDTRLGVAVRVIFAIAVILLAFAVLTNQGYNPFIYFRF